eukprot:926402_1
MAAQLVFLHNCVDSGLLHSKLKTHILLNDLNPNKESPAVRPLTQSYLSDDTVFALCRQHLVCGDRNIIEVIAKNDTIMHWTDGFILVVFSSSFVTGFMNIETKVLLVLLSSLCFTTNSALFIAATNHNCAIANHETKCWGYNMYVQLGYGNKKNRGDGPNEMGNNLLVIALGSS